MNAPVAGYPARKLALEVLLKIDKFNAYSNLALNAAFKRKLLSERDRAFVTALVQGVMRNRLHLDAQIAKQSKHPMEKLDMSVLNILRLAVFQLEQMPDIPPSAIINVSNVLAKATGHKGHASFVNGLLRNLLRQQTIGLDSQKSKAGKPNSQESNSHESNPSSPEGSDPESSGHELRAPESSDSESSNPKSAAHEAAKKASSADNASKKKLAKKKQTSERKAGTPTKDDKDTASDADRSAEQLATDYSIPQWLYERWLKNFGETEARELLKFAISTPRVVVRTCETAITPEGLQSIFEAKGIVTQRSKLVPGCFLIEKMKGPAEKLPGYNEGLFSIQDESAAFASLVVEPQKGEQIIDLCAAPGGKALHMAELLDNTGRVVAVDKSAPRLNLIKTNRTRLSLKNIEIHVADGRKYKANVLADKVLVDAPCTGTGVINRRADLRYQKESVDIVALTELQRELLSHAADLVKPGGFLIYSTCSMEPEENFDNIRWFLNERQDFEAADFSHLLPDWIKAECEPTDGPLCKTTAEMNRVCMIQLLPSRHGVSGFFVAKLQKRS